MELSALDYDLPARAVAQAPLPEREASRLLVIDRGRRAVEDRAFRELPSLLRPGDCLVVNDSRVLPARVFAQDAAGRRIELLFLEPDGDGAWLALVRPGRRCPPGTRLAAAGARLAVGAVVDDGVRRIERLDGTIEALMASAGLPPLPPYIARHVAPAPEDVERYQTVYADQPGSVAAPTAGLHFGPGMLDRLREAGIEVHALTLHVGPATFRPIRAAAVEAHPLPAERAVVPRAVAEAVNRARAGGRRAVAVGTTTTRALESAAGADGTIAPLDGRVGLFITPGYRFRVVDALLTNFHLPRSSLLALVMAFAGRELVLDAYAHAVRTGYRFYSYGDATLIA